MSNGPTLSTAWAARWQPEFVGTLLFVLEAQEVLLIEKLTGHGAGRINAPGGKLEPGESVVQCAIRETQEEVGVTAIDPVCGVEMRFVERNGPQWLGFAFLSTEYTGRPRPSREARPFWCPIDEIPYADMWPDDAIWLPRLLGLLEPAPSSVGRVEPLVMDFLFDDERLLDHRVQEQPSIWHTLRLSTD